MQNGVLSIAFVMICIGPGNAGVAIGGGGLGGGIGGGGLGGGLGGGIGGVGVDPDTIKGLLGKIDLHETDFGSTIAYAVDIQTMESGFTVPVFAVSNDGGSNPKASTTRPGWVTTLLKQAAWDDPQTTIAGSNSSVSFSTATVGSYSSLFGSDAAVSVYYLDDDSVGSAITRLDAENLQFTFQGNAATEFVALTPTGGVLDASAVPEPGSFACVGLIASLAALRWRRRIG